MQVKGSPISLKKSRRLGDSEAKIIGSMGYINERRKKREERKK
jgi:hypothetical protein